MEIPMRKMKLVVLPLLSIILLGFTFYTTDASDDQENVEKKDLNLAQTEYKEKLDKSKDENTKVKKEKVDKDNKGNELKEIKVEEVVIVEEIPKEEVKSVENLKKETIPSKEVIEKTPEKIETVDYIWQKESFGSINEIRVNDSNKESGIESTVQGALGQKEVKVKITYINGKEISRVKTGEESIISNPKDTTIYVGTKVIVNDSGTYLRGDTSNLFSLINAYRSSNGLSKLSWSDRIAGLADIRAKEQVVKFSHTRPNGQPWYSIDSEVAGENLAYGYSSQGSFDAWVESPGHNDILLMSAGSAGVSMYQSTDGTLYAVLLTAY